MSVWLSATVPKNKCDGHTHARTSHLWSTQSPSVIGPFAISQESRWVDLIFFPSHICPYPLLQDAVQSQHVAVLFTRFQNRSSTLRASGPFLPTALDFSISRKPHLVLIETCSCIQGIQED